MTRKKDPRDTEREIIALYRRRDEDAIRRTAEALGGYCYTVAYNVLNNREDAEECVNDAYLALWRSIPPKRPKPLKAYLAAVLRNLAIDRYRKNRRRANMRELEEAALELSPAIWVPDSAEEELKHLLSDFLRSLPEDERNLFMGRYWHGYSVKLLAKHYELTPNAVTKRLGGTREKLRGYLNERGYRIEE